jgi:predicted amidohydrolase YtcJ
MHCYTYGSAYVLNEEGELGTLEPGKLADYIILDGNPFSEDIRDVRTFKAFEVYVGDKRSYPPMNVLKPLSVSDEVKSCSA